MQFTKKQKATVVEQMSQSFIEELELLIPNDRVKSSIRAERDKLGSDELGHLTGHPPALRPSEALLGKLDLDSRDPNAKTTTADVQFVLKNRPQDIYRKILSER